MGVDRYYRFVVKDGSDHVRGLAPGSGELHDTIYVRGYPPTEIFHDLAGHPR